MSGRIALSLAGLACLLVLASCAQPMVTIPYNLPPELDIPPSVRNLGILPFTSPRGGPVADRQIGQQVSAKIEEFIHATQYYRIVDRTSLNKLLQERQLSFSDFAEGGQKDLKLRGVDAIITGKVTRFHYKRGRGRIKVLVKTRVYNRILRSYVDGYEVRQKPGDWIAADISISFRMINTKTGDILAVKSKTHGWDSRGRRSYKGQKYDTPTSELPDRAKVMTTLLDHTIGAFMKLIAPHTIFKSVRLIQNSPDSERGVKFAINKLLDKAYAQFKRAEATEDPPDGAIYNQGVMLEAMARYKEAEKAYERALDIFPDEQLYMTAINRVRGIMAKKAKENQ